MCAEKEEKSSCERSGKCEWRPDPSDDEEADCSLPTSTSPPSTTSSPAGCCHGDLTSYKANDKCVGIEDQKSCERKSCNWLITDDPEDCVVTTTTSTPRTTEMGCCAGTTAKNTPMCNEKVGREACERSGKCEFRVLEEDCSWPTTTSEPWLGAQAEADYALPYNPYKQQQMRKQSSKKDSHRQEEAMMFGDNGVVGQAMQYQVSLSSVLLMLVAAFALYQAYAWMANRSRKNKDYAAVQSPATAQQYYQSA